MTIYALPIMLLALASSSFASFSGDDSQPSKERNPGTIGLEFEPIDSPAGPGSSLPNLTGGADGKVYLTWVEKPDEAVTVLRFATFDDGKWSAPREIVRGERFLANWADFPSICALENGTLMAHWLRFGASNNGYNVEFSLSLDAGLTWSDPRRLHSDGSSTQHGFVSICALSPDAFAAIWLDGRRTVGAPGHKAEMSLYFRTIFSNGELGDEQLVDSRVCDCCQTSLVRIGDEGLLAAYRDRGHQEIRDIAFAAYDGSTWSKPAGVHADGWLMPGCPVNGPALAVANDTQAALWYTGVGGVLFSARQASAKSFGFPIKVDDNSPVGRVDLVACDGYFLASWMEHTEGAFGEWRVLPLGPQGPLGSALPLVKISTGRTAGFLRMAPFAQGCLVAWTGLEEGIPRIVTGRVRAKGGS